MNRPVALVTGAGRIGNIGTAAACALAEAGWDIAMLHWLPYDRLMEKTFFETGSNWGCSPEDLHQAVRSVEGRGAGCIAIEADLSLPETPRRLFDQTEQELGPVTALVMSHCHSVDSDIHTTTVESFDHHFAVNARAVWLLVREFGLRFRGTPGSGRIIGITSDHTAWNLPYGASKGAMERIVIASAHEFRNKGIRANVINPGATDTGWMSDSLMREVAGATLGGRVGLPEDCASLVRFLCSPDGGWVNGQILYSDGGLEYR